MLHLNTDHFSIDHFGIDHFGIDISSAKFLKSDHLILTHPGMIMLLLIDVHAMTTN